MTTMELIEKYGIGTNCLSDAYDLGVKQGRADAIKEMKGFIVDHGLYVTFKSSEWAEQIKEAVNG